MQRTMVLRIERFERKRGKLRYVSSRCYISPVDSGTFFPHFLSTVSKSVVGTVVVPITTTVVVVVATSTGYNPLYLEENEDRGGKEGERRNSRGETIYARAICRPDIYLYGLAPSVSDVDNEPRTVSWGRRR